MESFFFFFFFFFFFLVCCETIHNRCYVHTHTRPTPSSSPAAPQSTTGVLPGGPSAATSTGPPTSSTLPTQPATGPSGLVLPLGWEEKFDAQRGVPYFVDHNTRSTHWELPADIMAQAQVRVILRRGFVCSGHLRYSPPPPFGTAPQALTNPASAASSSGPASFGAQLMLPQGWEMKMDESRGIPYYVDHNTRSTHWELPAEIAAWSKAQQVCIGRDGVLRLSPPLASASPRLAFVNRAHSLPRS